MYNNVRQDDRPTLKSNERRMIGCWARFICIHSNKSQTVVSMTEKHVTVSARIRGSQVEEVERLAARRGADKSAILRELIATGLREQRLSDALELVRARKITVWRAAEVADITYREMLAHLKAHNITFPLSEEELKREAEEILGRQ